jgi:hypothetical protein
MLAPRRSSKTGRPMKLALFQQILELNQLLERLTAGLERLQSVSFFQRNLIQHARSDVEIARVYANREFFDNFGKIVEDDARWAYEFQRAFNEKLKDRDDIYLEVKSSEERRKRKGLPPRVTVLPDWDMSDEDRYDEEQARRRTRARTKKRQTQPQSKGEHSFEEGLLYIHVRFTDETELSWRIATRMTIEESDLADWTSGDFKELRVFVRNERDRSV